MANGVHVIYVQKWSFPFQVNSVQTDVGAFIDTYEFSFRSLLKIKQLGNYKKHHKKKPQLLYPQPSVVIWETEDNSSRCLLIILLYSQEPEKWVEPENHVNQMH